MTSVREVDKWTLTEFAVSHRKGAAIATGVDGEIWETHEMRAASDDDLWPSAFAHSLSTQIIQCVDMCNPSDARLSFISMTCPCDMLYAYAVRAETARTCTTCAGDCVTLSICIILYQHNHYFVVQSILWLTAEGYQIFQERKISNLCVALCFIKNCNSWQTKIRKKYS